MLSKGFKICNLLKVNDDIFMGAKIFSRMYIYNHLSPRFSTFSTLIIFGILIIFSTLIAMFIGGIQSAHESVFSY